MQLVFLAKQLSRLDYRVNLRDGHTFTHEGSGTTFGKNPKTPLELLMVAITPLTNLLFELYSSVKLVPSIKLSNITHVPVILKHVKKNKLKLEKQRGEGRQKRGSPRERERESSLSIGVPLATTKKREFSLIHNALSLYPNN